MLNKEKLITKLIKLLESEVVFAYIFGSVASERIHRQSDIDIGVYLNKPLESINAKLDFQQRISSYFDQDIDIIYLNDADIIIIMQVLTNGELIVDNNPLKHILYKASKLSEYADFKISRRIIEQNILKGQIYA